MKRLRWRESIWAIVVSACSIIAVFIMYMYFAYAVFCGTCSIGSFSLYTSAVQSLSGGVSGLITTTASIYEGTLFIDNLIAFLNEQPHNLITNKVSSS